MSEGGSKWTCSRCTYCNFAKSSKCTMCGALRSPHLILEAGTDIYQLGLRAATQQSPPLQEMPVADRDKWSCPCCTFLNFPKTPWCVQCRRPHHGLTEQMAALNLGKAASPGAVNSPSGECHNARGGGDSDQPNAGGAGRVSPRQDVRDTGSGRDLTVPTYKWNCRACTYENWPRASKCIMCGTGKGAVRQISGAPTAHVASPSPTSEAKNNAPTTNISVPSDTNTNNIATTVEIVPDNSKECRQTENSVKNEINKSLSEMQDVPTILKRSSESVHRIGTTVISNAGSGGTPATSPVATSQQLQSSAASGPQAVSLRTAEGAIALNNYETERLLRQLRRRLREADWAWLNACIGVVEGNYKPVETYLSAGGDPMRQLSSADVKVLSRPSAFDEGHTLVHLAIRFGREDLLATILSRMDGGVSGMKRVPSYVAPDLATDIKRYVATSFRQRKGNIPCYFVSDLVTFALPAEIEDLPSTVQEQLFAELLDREAQKQLEEDTPIINWSLEITDRLGSRLYALWNRTAGDCLLDSMLQATWGVFDQDNVLRRALADSLTEASQLFYPRWREYERWQARLLDYYVPEGQLLEEWAELICLASQPGAALEQLHIFVLAHILRRPVIVYGVKCVKSFRGEDLGFARFEGVYLPLMWEPGFCWRSPICLGYTRGHFSALVPLEPDSLDNLGAGAILDSGDAQVVFLPLMTHDAKLLPVHFLSPAEIGCEEAVVRQWMDVCVSEGGILVAQQHLSKKPLMVAQMTEEWLNHYRRLAQMECAPFTQAISNQGYSSDGDSEEE